MTFKYVSIGLSLSGVSGKISYLHDECAIWFNGTLGPKAKPTTKEIPKNTRCVWCGKAIEGVGKVQPK